MKKALLLSIIILSLSCKQGSKEAIENKANIDTVEINKPEKFVIEMNLKLSNSDGLRLFANGVFISNNRMMNINITEQVIKSEDFKTVVLDLPDNIKPDYEVGIALGGKEVKKVDFQSIKISYGDVEVFVSPDKISEYFYFSSDINYNPEKGMIQTQKIDGKHNPIMYVKASVIDQFN